MMNAGAEPPTRFEAAKSVTHWLIVAIVTLLGLLAAEAPLFPRTRDRVYLWLQHRIRGAQRRVVVVAIDDADFWHGAFAHTRPLDREKLAEVVTKIASANPDVIGLDVGLETPAPLDVTEDPPLLTPTNTLLSAIDTAGKRCSIVLPKTITGAVSPYHPEHDVYEPCGFDPVADVTLGHTSAPGDPRQIPTRLKLQDGKSLDSFALAIARASMHDDMPEAYEDEQGAWPYAYFLPKEAFRPKHAPSELGATDDVDDPSCVAQGSSALAAWPDCVDRRDVARGAPWRW